MSPELIEAAKHLYFKHMSLEGEHEDYGFMWDQCSTDYKAAWVIIAKELPHFNKG